MAFPEILALLQTFLWLLCECVCCNETNTLTVQYGTVLKGKDGRRRRSARVGKVLPQRWLRRPANCTPSLQFELR